MWQNGGTVLAERLCYNPNVKKLGLRTEGPVFLYIQPLMIEIYAHLAYYLACHLPLLHTISGRNQALLLSIQRYYLATEYCR